MKKLLAVLLALTILFGATACGAGENTATTAPEQTEATESPEEAKVLKIMILGSSRSVNTFQLLYEVFKDQMPEQELVLGIMYYSGCSMSMHANFIKNEQSVYDYYRNDSGRWEIFKESSMEMGLRDQAWDVILLQAGTGDLDNRLNEKDRIFLKDFVDKNVKHPHKLWWHSTWFNSTDPSLYDPTKTKLDPSTINQYSQLISTNSAAKEYALTDPMFAGHITSGTPMMYALKVLNVPEVDLYRDHTHLSDFGCLLVGYAWYAQFTGKQVTQINLETIPVHLRHKQYQNLGEMQVTEEMKQTIIKTVDYTLNNPWAIPGQE